MGVRKGVCDLFLPCAKRGYHGLYIEMKAPGGSLSPEQREFIKGVENEGYMAVVCYSARQAIQTLDFYLSGGAIKL